MNLNSKVILLCSAHTFAIRKDNYVNSDNTVRITVLHLQERLVELSELYQLQASSPITSRAH